MHQRAKLRGAVSYPDRRGRVLMTAALLATAIMWLPGCPLPNDADDDGQDDVALDPNLPPVTEGEWYRPGVNTTWQWQLQPGSDGTINTSYNVEVYDIDLFDTSAEDVARLHAAGFKVIAYFSAGTYEGLRPDAGEFQVAALGLPLVDYPDERWLDVRSENVRRIVEGRLDLALAKGFDGVEPDNIDGYANASGFDFKAADQLAFNRFVANAAHERGLAVGLKNDLDQVAALVAYFDFAVNEQCHEYDECDALRPFIDAGKPVFNAEYAAQYVINPAARLLLCADANTRGLQTLILPVALDDAFRLSCTP